MIIICVGNVKLCRPAYLPFALLHPMPVSAGAAAGACNVPTSLAFFVAQTGCVVGEDLAAAEVSLRFTKDVRQHVAASSNESRSIAAAAVSVHGAYQAAVQLLQIILAVLNVSMSIPGGGVQCCLR